MGTIRISPDETVSPPAARAPACFELWYSDTSGYRFQLRTGRGGIVMWSGFYATRSVALMGIETVRRNSTRDDRYRRLAGPGQTTHFELLAINAEPVGRSPLFDSDQALEDALSSVKRWAVIADLRELG